MDILGNTLTQLNDALAQTEAEAAPIFAKRDELLALISKAHAALQDDVMPGVVAAETQIADLRNQISAVARARGGLAMSTGPAALAEAEAARQAAAAAQ